jgi:hypothetical protein
MPKIQHRESILKAIKEYDSLGRDQFLKRYGFWPSRRYFLVHDGKRYDSKAIVGVAFGYENPSRGPLKWREFNGGYGLARGCLERLGFEVEVSNEAGPGRDPRSTKGRVSLRTLPVDATTFDACLAEAQHGRVILTRDGHPIALVVGADGLDEEQIRLGSSPEFWELIAESRGQKTISREEFERRLERKP